MRRSSTLVVACVLISAVGLTGCGGDGKQQHDRTARSSTKTATATPTPTPSPGEGTPSTPPTTYPLKFDMTSSTTFPEVDVQRTQITDSVVLTMTPKTVTARTLPGLGSAYQIAARSGRLTDIWVDDSQKTGVALSVARQSGHGTRIGTNTYILVRFDMSTGKATSTTTVQQDQDPIDGANPPTARVIGVAGDTAVLDTWAATDTNDAFASTRARHTTLGIDLGKRAIAWSRRPARPLEMNDTSVVVSTGTVYRPGDVEALGLADGATQWSALSRVGSASGIGITGDTVVVASTGPGRRGSTVTGLALADGTVSGERRTRSWNWLCFDAQDAEAVCTVGGSNRVYGWNLQGNAPLWTLPTKGRVAPSVSAVSNGIVYGAANGVGVALNARNGKDLAADTGAVPVGVSIWGAVSLLDGQAVFQRRLSGAS